MTNADIHAQGLDAAGAQNWMLGGAPASIINPGASLHGCIAWGWSEASALHGLAMGLSEIHACESPLVFDAAVTVFSDRLRALVVMLEHAGNLTSGAERLRGGVQ